MCSNKGCDEQVVRSGLCSLCLEAEERTRSNRWERSIVQGGAGSKAVVTKIAKPKVSQAEKQKTKMKQKAERIKLEKKAERQQAAESQSQEYFVIDENQSFDEIFASFQASHAAYTASLEFAPRSPAKKKVETMAEPCCDDEAAMEAWKNSQQLSCPLCEQGLRRLLKQQGNGGWHSILDHLEHCRERSSPAQIKAALSLSAARRVAWSEASAVLEERRQKQLVRTSKGPKKAQSPTAAIHCRICEREFRAGDTRSLEQHQASCLEKQLRRKQMHEGAVEDTAQKVLEAERATVDAQDALQRARQAAKKARAEGQRRAEEEKAAQRNAKRKHSAPRFQYPHPSLCSTATKATTDHTLEKADRDVERAQQQLEKAMTLVAEREEVAARVQERVTIHALNGYRPGIMQGCPQKGSPTGKAAVNKTVKVAKKPWEMGSKRRKKESKEVKATKAKEKSLAKKGRRSEGQTEGAYHESFSVGFTSTRRGKALMAMGDDD